MNRLSMTRRWTFQLKQALYFSQTQIQISYLPTSDPFTNSMHRVDDSSDGEHFLCPSLSLSTTHLFMRSRFKAFDSLQSDPKPRCPVFVCLVSVHIFILAPIASIYLHLPPPHSKLSPNIHFLQWKPCYSCGSAVPSSWISPSPTMPSTSCKSSLASSTHNCLTGYGNPPWFVSPIYLLLSPY